HRDEDAAAARHLDDETHRTRRLPPGAEDGDDVADPTHLVAQGVEDRQACQAGDEDPPRSAAHGTRLGGQGRRDARRARQAAARPRRCQGWWAVTVVGPSTGAGTAPDSLRSSPAPAAP